MSLKSSNLNTLCNTAKTVGFKNLAGSSWAVLVANNLKKTENTHLFVLPGKEEALFFFNDLEILLQDKEKPLSEKRVHYFQIGRASCRERV